MTVENFYTLRVETNLGPRYFVVAHAHLSLDVHLKNDKHIPFFSIRTDDILNPYGFATLDEIRYFYACYRVEFYQEQEKFENRFTRKISFYGNREKTLIFREICEKVLESLENPMTPEALFGFHPLLDASFNIGGTIEKYEGITLNMAIDIFQKYPKGATIDSFLFNSPLITKKQRKEMEKSYFVIDLSRPDRPGAYRYFKSIQKGSIHTTEKKYRAKQFRSENEVFAYIEKNESYFGRYGYEIFEIEGMTLEKGLRVEKISTL